MFRYAGTVEEIHTSESPSPLFLICSCHYVLLVFDHSGGCSNGVNCFAYLFPTFNVKAGVLICWVN